MKNRSIRLYTLILWAGFLINFYFFFSIMVYSYNEPPAENWSREIEVARFHYPASTNISSQYDIYDCIPYQDGYLMAYAHSDGITVNLMDSLFKIVETTSITYPIDENTKALHILSDADSTKKIAFYNIENKSLDFLDLEMEPLKIVSTQQTLDQVTRYSFLPPYVFYTQGSQLWCNSQDQNFLISEIGNLSVIKPLTVNASIYLFGIEKMDAINQLIVYRIDPVNMNSTRHVLKQLPTSTSITPQSITASIDKDQIHIITVFHNAKTAFNIGEYSLYSIDGLKLLSTTDLNFPDYVPNPSFYKSDDTINVGYIDSYQMGRYDVSRKYSSYPNYTVSVIEEGKLAKTTRLTKTEFTKIKPLYFYTESQKTLFWMEYDGDVYHIYGASNHSDLIRASQSLSFNDYFGIFMNALTTYVPALYSSMVFVFGVMLPVIVTYGFISFFKITWVEHYGKQILPLMIASHIILKYLQFAPTIHHTLVHMNGLHDLYSTFEGQILYSLFLTGLSLISFYLYKKTNPHNNVFVQYLRFSFLDCLLLITAFYPIYFV